MEIFTALLSLCAGNSPVTGEFPAQRPVMRSFMFSLICAWINSWVNNREAGDLRRQRAHYYVTVMILLADCWMKKKQRVSMPSTIPTKTAIWLGQSTSTWCMASTKSRSWTSEWIRTHTSGPWARSGRGIKIRAYKQLYLVFTFSLDGPWIMVFNQHHD